MESNINQMLVFAERKEKMPGNHQGFNERNRGGLNRPKAIDTNWKCTI